MSADKAFEGDLIDALEGFRRSNDLEFAFPAHFSFDQRRKVHIISSKMGLKHYSQGEEGKDRFITVFKANSPIWKELLPVARGPVNFNVRTGASAGRGSGRGSDRGSSRGPGSGSGRGAGRGSYNPPARDNDEKKNAVETIPHWSVAPSPTSSAVDSTWSGYVQNSTKESIPETFTPPRAQSPLVPDSPQSLSVPNSPPPSSTSPGPYQNDPISMARQDHLLISEPSVTPTVVPPSQQAWSTVQALAAPVTLPSTQVPSSIPHQNGFHAIESSAAPKVTPPSQQSWSTVQQIPEIPVPVSVVPVFPPVINQVNSTAPPFKPTPPNKIHPRPRQFDTPQGYYDIASMMALGFSREACEAKYYYYNFDGSVAKCMIKLEAKYSGEVRTHSCPKFTERLALAFPYNEFGILEQS